MRRVRTGAAKRKLWGGKRVAGMSPRWEHVGDKATPQLSYPSSPTAVLILLGSLFLIEAKYLLDRTPNVLKII